MPAPHPSETSQRYRDIDRGLVNRIAGFGPGQGLKPKEIRAIDHDISPYMLERSRLGAQALETLYIGYEASEIHNLIEKRGFKQPSAYGIFTLGFDPPKDAVYLGSYGKPPFEGFPKTAIKGHAGDVFIAPVGENGETMLILKGRAHPNEWENERFGGIMCAHPLRVIKEMVRRQRVDEHVNPPIVLTYVTGVTEGYKAQPGDLSVIIDDVEFANVLHPGYGPREILDEMDGEKFQPKAGRGTNPNLGKLLVEIAKAKGISTYPVAACGTGGQTEYQAFCDVPVFQEAFEKAKQLKGLKTLAEEIYGPQGVDLLAPLWDMGITFELATTRQTKKKERPFSVLALALPTDLVGGEQSLYVNHDLVAKQALKPKIRRRNTDLIMTFAREVVKNAEYKHRGRKDFSIRHEIFKYKPSGVIYRRGYKRKSN